MIHLRTLAGGIGVVNASVAVLLAILAALAFRTADTWLALSITAAALVVLTGPIVGGWTFLQVRR